LFQYGADGDTLKVTVTFVGLIRKAVGTGRIELELGQSATISSLMEKLCEKYGEEFVTWVIDPKTRKINRHIAILLNGVNILSLKNLYTKLQDNDHVLVTPVLVGG
jgi:molybdopterin converting factor small subunit